MIAAGAFMTQENVRESAMNSAVLGALVGLLERAHSLMYEDRGGVLRNPNAARYRRQLSSCEAEVSGAVRRIASLTTQLKGIVDRRELPELAMYDGAVKMLRSLEQTALGMEQTQPRAFHGAPVLLKLQVLALDVTLKVWRWGYEGFDMEGRRDSASTDCWNLLGQLSVAYPSLFFVCGGMDVTEGVRVWLQSELLALGVTTGAWTIHIQDLGEVREFKLALVEEPGWSEDVKDSVHVVAANPEVVRWNVDDRRYEMIHA